MSIYKFILQICIYAFDSMWAKWMIIFFKDRPRLESFQTRTARQQTLHNAFKTALCIESYCLCIPFEKKAFAPVYCYTANTWEYIVLHLKVYYWHKQD